MVYHASILDIFICTQRVRALFKHVYNMSPGIDVDSV